MIVGMTQFPTKLCFYFRIMPLLTERMENKFFVRFLLTAVMCRIPDNGFMVVSRLHFTEQMPECGNRMVKQHARTGVSHGSGNLFAHVLAVAMYRARSACGFTVAVRTALQTRKCIGKQFAAFAAQTSSVRVMAAAAEYAYHYFHRFLFSFYSFS